MRLALIRHGPTAWNAEGRVQGSVDTPLSDEGRAKMSGLRPPAGFEAARPFCSPKLRARETAALLGLENPTIDERLAEQNWGHWEGLTRAEMLARDGEDAFERAGGRRKLEFRPPGGESTGEVHARLRDFLTAVAGGETDAVAVTHMGVLRAAYVLATGWDMSASMPSDLDLTAALVLSLAPDGTPKIAQLNAPLRRRA
ncbi:MAG: histidine phosphatase family protein [Alphaproteobacteria bacterium]|nr:histidine phosphatase family protein [Alphaproteobacteria bacterium]MDE2109569.1 histidine phosphatase family protein [Alphaproteobacteria bacterium]MDE2493354.1 histidine phosphatase family protein [Alphaproteobacteria bacterium]